MKYTGTAAGLRATDAVNVPSWKNDKYLCVSYGEYN